MVSNVYDYNSTKYIHYDYYSINLIFFLFWD